MSPNAVASANEYSCAYGGQINFGAPFNSHAREHQSALPMISYGCWRTLSILIDITLMRIGKFLVRIRIRDSRLLTELWIRPDLAPFSTGLQDSKNIDVFLIFLQKP
jgi:hypothetical protein